MFSHTEYVDALLIFLQSYSKHVIFFIIYLLDIGPETF